jgi:hypothetical protein
VAASAHLRNSNFVDWQLCFVNGNIDCGHTAPVRAGTGGKETFMSKTRKGARASRAGDIPHAYTWKAALETPRVWFWEIAVAVGVGLWFGAIGPFGVYRGGPIEARLLCFGLLTPLITVFYGLAIRAAGKFGYDLGLARWKVLTIGLTVIVFSLPASMLIASFVPHFLLIRPRPSLPSLEWYLQTLVVTLPGTAAFVGVRALVLNRTARSVGAIDSAPRSEAQSQPGRPDACRLALRLAPRMGHDILALQAEDHYVRVFTAEGSDLILMRLSDAIDELDGKEGLRIHRSWWVARSAIQGMTAKGRQKLLRLSNGVDAPVARDVVAQVKTLGWIPSQ